MKICILTKSIATDTNGYGRYSRAVIDEFKKADNLELKIFTEDDSGDYSFPRFIFFNSFIIVLWSFFRLKQLTKDCEIIHGLDAYPYGVMGAFAKLWTQKKLFISALGSYAVKPLFSFFPGLILKFAYRKADMVFAASNFTQKKIKNLIPLENITVINMGISPSFINCIDKKEHLSDLPEQYIMSVGALKYRKGYHISIPAFAKTREKFPKLQYIIVGSQEGVNYYNKLKELVRKYNLGNSVIFLRNIDDNRLRCIYKRAEMFLLTSITAKDNFEGFGIVYLEAGLFGLPSIGSKDSGAEDAILDNKTGFLLPQNDISALADKLSFLLSDKSLRSRLGSNAKKHALSLSWANIVNRYLSFYYR